MEKVIHICKGCRRAIGTISYEDILFNQDYYLCSKCNEKEKEDWERLLECTD